MERSLDLVAVRIDPRFQVHYSSYYICGLKQLCSDVRFGWLDNDAVYVRTPQELKKGCALVAFYKDGSKKRVFIDTDDGDDVSEEILKWCDVYGKINLNTKDYGREKILPIGPSFAIRLWNPVSSLYHICRNYAIVRTHKSQGLIPSIQTIAHSFIYLLYRRERLAHYLQPYKEDKDYIYTMNTLWYDSKSDVTTNHLRGVFALTCKRVMPKFEGGFFYIDDPVALKEYPEYSKYLTLYKEILTKKRVSMSNYMTNIKKSSFVFNTPAVSGCLGWKMGEYFALGKAIVSTPIKTVIPGCDNDEKPFLLAENESDLEKTILRLRDDQDLRMRLKMVSKKYYNEWLAPEVVMTRLLKK